MDKQELIDRFLYEDDGSKVADEELATRIDRLMNMIRDQGEFILTMSALVMELETSEEHARPSELHFSTTMVQTVDDDEEPTGLKTDLYSFAETLYREVSKMLGVEPQMVDGTFEEVFGISEEDMLSKVEDMDDLEAAAEMLGKKPTLH